MGEKRENSLQNNQLEGDNDLAEATPLHAFCVVKFFAATLPFHRTGHLISRYPLLKSPRAQG